MSEKTDDGFQTRPITRVFIITLALVVFVFLGYELFEQYWLSVYYPGLVYYFHIARGVGTALIVAGFITWYFMGVQPYHTAHRIFLSMRIPDENEYRRQMKKQLVRWFIRMRWFVSSIFVLGLILTATVIREVLWQGNFVALFYLFWALVGTNLLYRLFETLELYDDYQLPLQIVTDFLLITLFLFFTGGVRNPGFLLYIPHVLMATIVFSPAGAYLCSGLAMVLFGGIGFLEFSTILPPYSFPFLTLGSSQNVITLGPLSVTVALFSGVVMSTTFLASLVMESLRNYRNNLREEKEYTQKLVEKQYTVREEERERVSRELHDQIGQSLSAVRMKISRLKSEKLASDSDPLVESLEETVEDAIDEVRELSHRLRPSSLDDCGLPCAIENYAEEIEQEYGVIVDYEWLGLGHAENISRTVDTAMYRIAQEAVMNAVEHATPDRISVILQRVNDYVQLLVEDDGAGFDTSEIGSWKPSDTLGIQGMKERAQLLNGRFFLESSPNGGTRVRVEIPIDAEGDLTMGRDRKQSQEDQT